MPCILIVRIFVWKGHAVNLQEQGYRFVLRMKGRTSYEAKWVHPTDIRPNDQDCTSLSDEEFDEALRSWDEHCPCAGD
jgi:hypothetical protein